MSIPGCDSAGSPGRTSPRVTKPGTSSGHRVGTEAPPDERTGAEAGAGVAAGARAGTGGAGGGSRQRQPRPHRHRARQVGAGRGGRSFLRRRAHAEQPAQLLVVRLRAIERRGELLHPAVLLLQPRDLLLEAWNPCRGVGEGFREREEQHDQHGDRDRAPLSHLERPEGRPILAGIQIAVQVDDDRDAPPLHPSNGAPSTSSSRRARSSFE